MNSIDAVAGILIGAFILTAVVRGNGKALIAQAEKDKAFAKWAIALMVLIWLYGIPEIHGPATYIMGLAIIGMLISNVDNVTKNLSTFWSGLK